MSATAAVRSATDALRRNPVLFVAAATFAVVTVPSYLLQVARIPFASAAWSGVTFFVSPFLTGGLLAMASDALDGDASLSRFARAGKENYVSLLLVAVLVAVVVGAIALLGGIVVAVLGIFVLGFSGTGMTAPSGGAMVLFGGAVLAFVLVVFLVSFLLQFVNQAVVLDDDGPVDAVKDSYWTVRHNLVGAFGVAFVGFVVSGVFMTGPVMVATLSLQSGALPSVVSLPDGAAYAVLFVWGTVATVVFGAFVNTMLVAFYDEHSPAA